jgi:N,N'-diacetyllegionaminate synthase
VVVLLGFQGYPTPDDTNHISRVTLLVRRFRETHPDVQVGFADHAAPESPLRFALAAAAVGAGATVIEKHLTLGCVMKLEDHESALNPDEFLEFAQAVRGCALGMGNVTEADDFGMSAAEEGYRAQIRRHVVAATDLAAGTTLTPEALVLKRTSASGAVMDLTVAYGVMLQRPLAKDAPLLSTDID